MRDEPLVEHADLTVEDQGARGELGDGGGDLREAGGVVDAVPADELDAGAGLERQHPPAVLFPLVHPPVTMERVSTAPGMDGLDARQRGRLHRARSVPRHA